MTGTIAVRRLPHSLGLDLPTYATAGAAGMDLLAAVTEPVTIAPGGRASSRLGLTFVVAPADGLEVALRIARADGTLVPTRREAKKAEVAAREAAERRVAELEAELRRRGG